MENSRTGVEIEVGVFPHAFFLFSPKIDIDGQVRDAKWGEQFYSLAAGRHTIRIGFMYLFMPWSAKGSFEVR